MDDDYDSYDEYDWVGFVVGLVVVGLLVGAFYLWG